MRINPYLIKLNSRSVIRFGEYKGQSVRRVTIKDPDYIIWLSTQQNITISEKALDFAKSLVAEAAPFEKDYDWGDLEF